MAQPNVYVPPLNKILKLKNYDEMFVRNPDAKIINNGSLISQNLSKEFTDAIFSDLGDEVSFVATCKCGEYKGNYFEGTTCPTCKTIVTTAFSDRLTHSNWIGIPPEFPPLINPMIYQMLKIWGEPAKNSTSIIDAILNPSLELPEEFQPPIVGRGFQYFYDNIDMLINYLFNNYTPTASRKNNEDFLRFLNIHRDKLFVTKLPILHPSLHPITKSGQKKYVDKSSKEILQVVSDLTCMTFVKKKSIIAQKAVNKTLFDILTKYVEYLNNLTKQKLGDKYAIIRQTWCPIYQ
jgi:hypothetical protein